MVLAENQKIRIASRAENGNILVAITEAVNNAIYHGNQANPKKNIDIFFKSFPDHVSFIVKDEGKGFNYDSLPDPTNPENIENPNGRGVFLMRNLADNVSFEENGSKVILDFKMQIN